MLGGGDRPSRERPRCGPGPGPGRRRGSSRPLLPGLPAAGPHGEGPAERERHRLQRVQGGGLRAHQQLQGLAQEAEGELEDPEVRAAGQVRGEKEKGGDLLGANFNSSCGSLYQFWSKK